MFYGMPIKDLIKRKEYHRNYARQHYLDNKDAYIERARKSNANLRKEAQTLIKETKKQPCADCKKTYPPCVMDFDHLKDKKFNISRVSKITLNDNVKGGDRKMRSGLCELS
jgi:hypothetical protein